MSTYESAYKSLLQGVSQQLPQSRLPGQLTAQVNMLSDPVTNLRRRPGVTIKRTWDWTGSASTRVLGWFTDIAGFRVNILLNTVTGNIRILDEAFTELASIAGGSYLVTADPSTIRTTSVGNEFFVLNTAKTPVLNYPAGGAVSLTKGFFYVVAGAFSKLYTVTLTYGVTVTASYTTPSGAAVGDAALSTPEYIATQLYNSIVAQGWVGIYRDGPYVFAINGVPTLSINTNIGTGYLIVSKSGVVPQVGQLPARLPAQADAYVCKVGTGDSPQYYKYNSGTTEWLEVGAPGSPSSITQMPVSIIWDSGTSTWKLSPAVYEGRLAGDDISNAAHEFMTMGITGMSTFQGRLVLMSGPLVSASASNKPRRFFRSTLTSVLGSDAFEIGSSTNSSAAYEWALPFQKDLVLFSRAYQAVIPSGNTAVTPSTAIVVPTEGHEVDTLSSPISLGRTLMYCSPKSADFFGAYTMIPSDFTDSQYVSQDSTPHLPKYLAGRCRFAVSSTVANMAIFSPTGDPNALIVYEYYWDDNKLVQQSWHQWVFPLPIATAYFASDVIVLVFVQAGTMLMGTIDPRAGAVNTDTERRPFLDLNINAPIVDHAIAVPAWLLPHIADLKAVVPTGALAGEEIGVTVDGAGTGLTTVLSYPTGTAQLGIPYYSAVIPTPPVVTDYNGEVVHSGKATLLQFRVGTEGSSEFHVTVTDNYAVGDTYGAPTLSWSSPELALGRGLHADSAVTVVPCRTDLRSTAMEVFTEGTGELNITSLEYIAKYNTKIKRR